MTREPVAATEVFKALSDPIRWNIIQQIAQDDEFPCSRLEDTLPVSKPTISYHTKILTQAGLIEVNKRGRKYYYRLRRDVLGGLVDELWALAPSPRLVGEPAADRATKRSVARKHAVTANPAAHGGTADDHADEAEDAKVMLLTW